MISSPSTRQTSSSSESLAATETAYEETRPYSSVSWASIFAGIFAAMALQVLFMLLGAGVGLAIYSPLTEENPIVNLGAGALVVQGISAVVSLWFGGWVAGRFTPRSMRRTGWLHGFITWCVATVAGVLFVSAGAGWALGDLSKAVGSGLSAARKPLASLAGQATDAAKDAAKQPGDTIASFVEEATGRAPADAPKGDAIRNKREIGIAVARFFNPMQQSDTAERRAALVKALGNYAGVSEADANRLVDDWTASYDRLKADLAAAKNVAETKAREAADRAAKSLAMFSLCAFGAFILGGLAASAGGHFGAKNAVKSDEHIDTAIG